MSDPTKLDILQSISRAPRFSTSLGPMPAAIGAAALCAFSILGRVRTNVMEAF